MLVQNGPAPHAQLLGSAKPTLAMAASRRLHSSNGCVVDRTRSIIDLNPCGPVCDRASPAPTRF